MHARTLRRGAALVAASALTVSTLGAGPALAADPAPSATSWLAGETSNGLLTYDAGGPYTDVGLSIDAGLAYADLGQTAQLNAVRDGVATRINGYAYGDEYDADGNVVQVGYYGAQMAKAMVLAQVAGANPRAYGGVDLVANLEGLTLDSGPSAGRITSNSSYGDFSNTIGQAFAARGLASAGSPEAGRALDFLLAQQCTGGYFREAFPADPGAAGQSCVDSDPASADTTALAALQLAALKSSDPRVTGAIDRATGWLAAQQQPDGTVGTTLNGNTTGLAAWALADQGRCLAAGRAANQIRTLQVPASATGAAAADVGAVALDRADFDAAQAGGISDAVEGRWLRATAQAAPGLDATLSPTLTAATGPKTFVKGGTSQWLRLEGVAAGDNVCLTGPEGDVTTLKATGATLSSRVSIPRATDELTYRIAYAGGERTVDVKVLDKLKVKTKIKRKVIKRGAKQVLRFSRFEAGEKVKVTVNGKKIKKGKANANGVLKVTFTVRGPLAKRKKAFVKVIGQFGKIRKDTAKFRVLR